MCWKSGAGTNASRTLDGPSSKCICTERSKDKNNTFLSMWPARSASSVHRIRLNEENLETLIRVTFLRTDTGKTPNLYGSNPAVIGESFAESLSGKLDIDCN